MFLLTFSLKKWTISIFVTIPLFYIFIFNSICIELFADIQLGDIYQSLMTSFFKHPKKQILQKSYLHIVRFFKNLYCIAHLLLDRNNSREELLQTCLELASVPWISTIDPPWFDLKIVNFTKDQLFQILNALNSSSSEWTKIQESCLELLQVASHHATCHTWIAHIVRNSMSNSGASAIHKQLLDLLPEFIFRSVPTLSNTLLLLLLLFTNIYLQDKTIQNVVQYLQI